MQNCKSYFILVASLTSFLFDTFNFINNLYIFIIKHILVYKPIKQSFFNKNKENKF